MFIGYGTWKWIETHARTGQAPVYRYSFDRKIPVPADAVGFAFTVFVLKNGSVQVYGPLKDVDSCVKCLELGIDRVKQFAAERAAEEESKAGAAS